MKPKVLVKFAVTHTGNLQDYLNRPIVDQDKACARLLLHKSLQEKYNYIRKTFSNIPISDLLMSRLERRKMKKEALEKQKMKKGKFVSFYAKIPMDSPFQIFFEFYFNSHNILLYL